MNDIWIEFKTKSEQLLKPLGFKLYRKTFYRVVNDVLQTLMFQAVMGVECTAYFNILDLAIGLDALDWEQFSIHSLREGEKKEWYLDDKEYNKISKHNETIVPEMFEIISRIVIPLFQKATDSVNSLNELTKFSEEHQLDDTGLRYWDNSFYTYLKLGEYEKAIDFTAERIKRVPPNFYRRVTYIKYLENQLRELKLGYELSTTTNFEKRRIEILAEDNLSKQFISNACEGFFKSINQYPEDTINKLKFDSITSSIGRLEQQLSELSDENSETSRERAVKELEEDRYREKKITPMLETIRLLSIPDREYFVDLVRRNEEISKEYLKHPSKKKPD